MLKNKNLKERRPFKLVKYFTFTSLIVMFVATIAIYAINAHWVKKILREKNEEYAYLLVENLNHQIFLRFFLPVALKYKKIRLRDENQYKMIDDVVKATLHGFNVETVNIYDLNNVISYSFDPEKIGLKNAGGENYKKALDQKSTSYLIKKGNFIQLLFGFPSETRIVTFAPLKMEKPLTKLAVSVIGVIEIVQNVSKDYKKNFNQQIIIITAILFVMGILFIALIFVVKKGETIIDKRNKEELRLKEKLRKAEHLSAIGEMTAGISHEIRNPLGIITSSAGLLKKKMEKLNISKTIPDIIVEESDRLNNIIKDFLDFAKPMTPDIRPCYIEDIIEKNISFLMLEIQNQGFEIEKNISQNLPQIMADSSALYQAFLNILLNSCQAMSKNKGKIIITIFLEDKNIILLFKDQGKGIKHDELEKIWTPFFTTKEKGTGLGLGIVKNIIESHAGKIEISNRKVQGVQVKITLPIKKK